jgi:hypothetical protein
VYDKLSPSADGENCPPEADPPLAEELTCWLAGTWRGVTNYMKRKMKSKTKATKRVSRPTKNYNLLEPGDSNTMLLIVAGSVFLIGVAVLAMSGYLS